MTTAHKKPWSQTAVRCYRGWTVHESSAVSAERSRFVVIDDLAHIRVQPYKFQSKSEILAAFENITETTAQYDGPFPNYTTAKIAHSLAFLRHVDGQRTQQEQIIARGTPWTPVTDTMLSHMLTNYQRARETAVSVTSTRAVEEYLTEPLPLFSVGAAIQSAAEPWLKMLYEALPWLQPFRFTTRTVESPAGWRNLVTCDQSGFVLLVNGSPHHCYSRALVDCFALHEICGHMAHLAQLAAISELQRNAPHLLCIAIHTQDSLLTEGIAQLLAGLLVYRLAPQSHLERLAFRQFELFFAVRHRNIMDLLEERIDIAHAVDRHCTYLGGDSTTATATYQMTLRDPFFCCQALNYFSGFEAVRSALNLDEAVLQSTLQRLLTGFHNAPELQAIARGHAA